MGCRSDGLKSGPNNCDFICFEDVGTGNYWNYPFTVCINDPTKELKDCIAKHLGNSPANEFGPENTLVDIVKISPGDFRQIETPISDFVSNAKGQLRGQGEYGTVRVTIFYGSKMQSKDIARDDYKVLFNHIPVEVLQRNPRLATGLRGMSKSPSPNPRSSAVKNSFLFSHLNSCYLAHFV
jgi:hypothetical protein